MLIFTPFVTVPGLEKSSDGSMQNGAEKSGTV